MRAIHYKRQEGHRYMAKVAYVVLGITMDGRKRYSGRLDRASRRIIKHRHDLLDSEIM